MEEVNPVVLLVENEWHIVEHSRRSQVALCARAPETGWRAEPVL